MYSLTFFMKNIYKIAFLVIALIVPSLIYLSLRGFGENKFEIPVYYQTGMPFDGCLTKGEEPHLFQFEPYELQSTQLFYLPQWVNDDSFYQQCARIKEKHPNVVFTAIADTSNYKNLERVLLISDEAHLYEIVNCGLVLGQEVEISTPIFNQLVLVDINKQIRGYFNGNELEDMDRLDMELDILGKEDK